MPTRLRARDTTDVVRGTTWRTASLLLFFSSSTSCCRRAPAPEQPTHDIAVIPLDPRIDAFAAAGAVVRACQHVTQQRRRWLACRDAQCRVDASLPRAKKGKNSCKQKRVAAHIR
jgi:hypothetical protein